MITWNLTLDGIFTVGSVGMGGLGMLWHLSARFIRLESALNVLKEDSRKIAGAMEALAVQKQRLDYLEKMMDELRHGEGKVLPLHRGVYEYPKA